MERFASKECVELLDDDGAKTMDGMFHFLCSANMILCTSALDLQIDVLGCQAQTLWHSQPCIHGHN